MSNFKPNVQVKLIRSIPSAKIHIAPNWVVRTYFELNPPGTVTMGDVEAQVKSQTHAKQFVHVAVKQNLLVRYARGQYVALDPSIALRIPALPRYWGRLLAIHNALDILSIGHAFACLTTLDHSDLIPENPWPVVHPDDHKVIPHIDAYGYRFGDALQRGVAAFGMQVVIPATNLPDTALLLAATSLPRETAAAKQILGKTDPDRSLASKSHGEEIQVEPGIPETVSSRILVPRSVRLRKRELADAMLRGSLA